jgi:DNA-binding NtrC family response regulator
MWVTCGLTVAGSGDLAVDKRDRRSVPSGASEEAKVKVPSTLHSLLARHERVILIQTLAANGFSRTRAAEALGISRQYLWHRVRILNIDPNALPRRYPGRPRKKFV